MVWRSEGPQTLRTLCFRDPEDIEEALRLGAADLPERRHVKHHRK